MGLLACYTLLVVAFYTWGLTIWQTALLSFLGTLLYRLIKGGTPLPLPLPENKPKWIVGNSVRSGVSMVDNIRNFYDETKQHKMSIYWEFGRPCIMATDLDFIKQVQVTAFDHFSEGYLIPDDYLKVMGLQLGLIDARGEEWRTLKKLLTPAFSGPRIRKTAAAMNRVAKLLVQHLKEQERNEKQIKILEDLEKFAMTCLAEVAFGIDINCFSDPENAFFIKGKTMTEVWRLMGIIFFPKVMKWFRIAAYNPKSVKHFEKMCLQIVEQRKGSSVEKKDILDSLIKASKDCPLMTPDMMFKTMTQFLTDGYEGFSRIMNSTIYLLTAHPQALEKLEEEIEEVMGERDDVTEEDLVNMVYLEQVVCEGIRMNCVMYTFRECVKPYKVPGSEHTIPKGTRVIIPIAGLAYDKDIWVDPETFRPERFSSENKGSIPSAAYQPFGIGARQCPAPNLMKMEMKVMLCHLVKNFRLTPRDKMEMPLAFHPTENMLLKEEVKVDISSKERE